MNDNEMMDELMRIRNILSEYCNDMSFEYNDKKSGVTVKVENSIPTFQVWHGDEIKEYENVDAVLKDTFYSGKSISELIEIVEFSFH